MTRAGFPPVDATIVDLLRSLRATLHSDAGVLERMSVNAERIAEEKRRAEADAAMAEEERLKRVADEEAAAEAKRISDAAIFEAAVAAAVEKLAKGE